MNMIQNQERFTDEQKAQITKLVDDTAEEALATCAWIKTLSSEGRIAARSGDFERAIAIMREVERFTNGQRNNAISDVANGGTP